MADPDKPPQSGGGAIGSAIGRGLGRVFGRVAANPVGTGPAKRDLPPVGSSPRQAPTDRSRALSPKILKMAEHARAHLNDVRSVVLKQRPDEKNFMACFAGILCDIASADGPIQEHQAVVFNHVLARTDNVTYYNNLSTVSREVLYKGLSGIFWIATEASAYADEKLGRTGVYDRDNNPITGLVTELGHLVIALDRNVSTAKWERLSKIISLAQEQVGVVFRVNGREKEGGSSRSNAQFNSSGQVQVKAKEKSQPTSETLEQCLQELRSLIGLSSVKNEVEDLINLAKVFALRKQKGLPTPQMSFHLVFSGNPGTGKTTVARIIAKVYVHLKLLSKGHLIEVDRSGLVGNYVGQTATKVKDVIEKAKGGVLFIDEAYALAESSSENDFGHEAIDTLLKAMEDYREDLVVIAAGYIDKMEHFLASNPGLRSRFPHVIAFPDYSAGEMVEIFELIARESKYRLSDGVKGIVAKRMEQVWQRRGKDFANARDVRNLFERVVSMQANRIVASGVTSNDALMTITEADVEAALT
jgi:Holliday junction resolvasome RuvABC ATP-dependent DNA helicase subunit